MKCDFRKKNKQKRIFLNIYFSFFLVLYHTNESLFFLSTSGVTTPFSSLSSFETVLNHTSALFQKTNCQHELEKKENNLSFKFLGTITS